MRNCLLADAELFKKRSKELIPLKCGCCFETFFRSKKTFLNGIRSQFCSVACAGKIRRHKETLVCPQCNIEFKRYPNQMKRSIRSFCSQSCSATFNNKNKKYGTRRSKLEVWLENRLCENFPKLEFHFNRKDQINSELDIYIPSLKLAFELNGIFHYEPIFGKEKLINVQNNDLRKFQACHEQNIELCIIDTLSMKYFKVSSAMKFLDIISNIIITTKLSPPFITTL